MERQVLSSGMEAVVLRYGFFYGPGTWHADPIRKPPLHIDAAAQATLLAVARGRPGIYNIAEDGGLVSIAKARAELGFDPGLRLPA
jgi:nucleoside-diphosphate-sugar epimerase